MNILTILFGCGFVGMSVLAFVFLRSAHRSDLAVVAANKEVEAARDLRAKPIVNLIVDRSVVNKFLIDTLEAHEPIDSANMFCIGGAGDAWQQTAKALLKKYDITAIDPDGWMVASPKPENEVEFFEYTGTVDAYIVGLWGATIEGLGEKLQKVRPGDFICRQPHEHADQWVVNRTLFLNTYSELGGK